MSIQLGREHGRMQSTMAYAKLAIRRIQPRCFRGWSVSGYHTGLDATQGNKVRHPQLFDGRTELMLEGAVDRLDQRVKACVVCAGLLTDGACKSMQPMAQRLRVDHQQLQQFVTSSTWNYRAVQANVAR